MIVALEYIICQHQNASVSVAIKSHRKKRQNPGLDIQVAGELVTWELVGLNAGEVETADPSNPATTRIDFYIGRSELLNQLPSFTACQVSVTRPTRRLTNPTGSIRRGGKLISWRGPLAKIQIQHALAFFPDGRYLINTFEDAYLNIDWEPAMYPLQDRTRTQLHFGVQSPFNMRVDNRRRIPQAIITMTCQQYAEILANLHGIR